MQRHDASIALGLAALLAITACVLWPGVHGPFLFDDAPNLQNLREIDGHFTRQSVGVYLSLFTGTPGRPLSALSFLINDDAWPSEPLGFKLTNLWIHLLNGMLVFGLARTLARAQDGEHKPGHARADIAALICAAIWLLSPIQISAIFLTVQRMAQLAGTFMFAGLWAYAAITVRARTSWRALAALAVAGIATVLAMLAKENGVLIPLLAWMMNVTVLRMTLLRLPTAPSRWISHGIVAANGLLALLFASRWASLTSFSSRDYTMWERVMSQGRALLDYISLIVMPRLSSSSLYNDDFAISRSLHDPATTLPALLLVLGALLLAVLARRRWPLAAFAILFFLAAHALESTVFPLEMYFEHRNYVPLFGPAFAVAMLVTRVEGDLRKPLWAGIGLWLVMAAGITHLQAKVWGNEAALIAVWQAEHPNSLRAQQEYAQYLFKNGQAEKARSVLVTAAERHVSPVHVRLQALLVDCSTNSVQPGDLETVRLLLRSEPVAPGTAVLLSLLRKSVQAGTCPREISPEDWLRMTQDVLDSPRGGSLRRMLLMERAELFLAADQLDAAIREMSHAYGSKGEPRIAFYASALLATAGRYEEAREWARRPQGRPWTWKHWLAQTDRQSNELIKAIDKAQAEQRATPPPAARARGDTVPRE